MTNEKLMHIGRTIEVTDKDEWLVKDRILFMYRPVEEYPNEPDKFALLFYDSERVDIVYFMGSYDIHWLIFPEHRGKGYMSHFVKSGVIKDVEPELKAITIDESCCENYRASVHLAKAAGLKILESRLDRDKFSRQEYEEDHRRFNSPCPCSSGEKYKCCCRDKDDEAEYEKMHCPECGAKKMHTTAKTCWKCGEEYEDYALV
jgi:hypothetical protein